MIPMAEALGTWPPNLEPAKRLTWRAAIGCSACEPARSECPISRQQEGPASVRSRPLRSVAHPVSRLPALTVIERDRALSESRRRQSAEDAKGHYGSGNSGNDACEHRGIRSSKYGPRQKAVGRGFLHVDDVGWHLPSRRAVWHPSSAPSRRGNLRGPAVDFAKAGSPRQGSAASADLPGLGLQMPLDLADHCAGVVAPPLREQQQIGHQVDDIAGRLSAGPSAIRAFSVDESIQCELGEIGSFSFRGHGRATRPPGHLVHSARFGPARVALKPTAEKALRFEEVLWPSSQPQEGLDRLRGSDPALAEQCAVTIEDAFPCRSDGPYRDTRPALIVVTAWVDAAGNEPQRHLTLEVAHRDAQPGSEVARIDQPRSIWVEIKPHRAVSCQRSSREGPAGRKAAAPRVLCGPYRANKSGGQLFLFRKKRRSQARLLCNPPDHLGKKPSNILGTGQLGPRHRSVSRAKRVGIEHSQSQRGKTQFEDSARALTLFLSVDPSRLKHLRKIFLCQARHPSTRIASNLHAHHSLTLRFEAVPRGTHRRFGQSLCQSGHIRSSGRLPAELSRGTCGALRIDADACS
ncbi:hypothetical protein LDDCCGHA_0696 [Methylobacterium oxalidis]|nr:hypothetical protein LDDCCGHA_0696 [Methylobacterium oxalidis]